MTYSGYAEKSGRKEPAVHRAQLAIALFVQPAAQVEG